MAAELASNHRLVRYPVQLQRATLPDMRVMSVERAFAAAESHHHTCERRHLFRIIIEISPALEANATGPRHDPTPGSSKAVE